MAANGHSNGSAQLILERIRNRVNIMIVEDHKELLEKYEALLASSPALRVSTARSIDEARELTRSGRRKWHCWLLDLFLGDGEMATGLLPRYSNYPYVVAMNAQSSPQDTSEAMRLGALYVMDKTEARMADVAEMVCRVSALGVLLKGEPTHRREVFEPLIYERCITSVEQWHKHAGI